MPLRRNNYFWEIFAKTFGLDWFYGGEIVLSYGDYTATIKTRFPVKKAWVNVKEEGTTVCCGDVSLVGTRVFCDRVEIDAKIRSESATIEYFLDF